MQRIERYGVIALVFLLVTILAVAVWGQRKNQSLLSFLKSDKTSTEVGSVQPPLTSPLPSIEELNLSRSSYDVQPTTPLVSDITAPLAQQDDQIAPPAGPGAAVVSFDHGDKLQSNSAVNEGFLKTQEELARARAAQVSTPPASARNYVVKPGDTLGLIAQRELGSTKRWQEIEALNGVKPERLAVGMSLKLPSGGAVAGSTPTRSSPPAKTQPAPVSKPSAGTYTVRSGDSLSRIADAQLGSADRYREILALNPGIKADKLSIGQVLRMPSTTVAAAPAKTNSTQSSKSVVSNKARVQ
jgi:LysM repeat protein